MNKRLAAALGGLLLFTACTKGHSSTAPAPGTTSTQAQLVSLVQGARSKAVAEKTAHFTQTIAVTPVSGTAVTINANGSMDVPNHRIGMTFSLPGTGDMEAVLDSGVIYGKVPQIASPTGGKPWFKIDPASFKNVPGGGPLASLMSSFGTVMKRAQSQDPTSGLSLLAGVSGSVTTVGHDSIRGVATTHYTFQVDSARALTSLPADAQAAVKSFAAQLGVTTVPTEAWIDSQGRIRRMHMTVDTSKPAASPSPVLPGLPPSALPKSTEITMELFDYGAPVSITVPPADQVTDFGAMLSQMGGTS
jgi:hypothetical protein